jgi:hypothetical protein
VALTAFPEASNASKGIGRILARKTYEDPVKAVQSLSGLTREELLRIIGQTLPPALVASSFEFVSRLEPVDLAQFAVIQCYSFHCGYSVCLGDAQTGANIHVEYEQQRAGNAASASPTSPGGNPA